MNTTITNVGNVPAWLRFPNGDVQQINQGGQANLVAFGIYQISNQVLLAQPPPVPPHPHPPAIRTLVNLLQSTRPVDLVGPGLPFTVVMPGNAANLPVGQVDLAYN